MLFLALLPLTALSQQAQEAAPEATDTAPRYWESAPHRSRFAFHEATKLTMTRVRSSMNAEAVERETEEPIMEQIVDRAWLDDLQRVKDGRRHTTMRTIDTATSTVHLSISQRGEQHQTSARRALDIEGKRVRIAPRSPQGSQPGDAEDPKTEVPSDAPPPIPREAQWIDRPEGAPQLPWEKTMTAGPTAEGLLPPAAMRELTQGQTWKVPGTAFAELLDPCAMPAPVFPMMEGLQDPDCLPRFAQFAVHRAAQDVDGSAVATWKGIREVEGSRLGHIAFTIDLNLAADTTEWMRTQSLPYEMAAIGRGAKNAKQTMHLEGIANLYWDMDRSRMAEFSLEADVTADFDQDYEFNMRNMDFNGIIDITMKGKTTLELIVMDAPR